MRFRLSILGVLGGAAAGAGTVVLLQQSAVLYPEAATLGAAAGAGALAGLLLPTMARPRAGRRPVAVPLEGVPGPVDPATERSSDEPRPVGRGAADDLPADPLPGPGPAAVDEAAQGESVTVDEAPATVADTADATAPAETAAEAPATVADTADATAPDETASEGTPPTPDEPAAAAAPDPAGGTWRPTHVVPPQGMVAWAAPDPALDPVAQLAGGVELVVEETAGAWAHVRGSNGWQGWVDGRLLVPPTA